MLNQLKTVLLLGILSGLVLVVGALVGGRGGLFVALIIALIFNFVSYFYSHKIVLKMYRAKEARKSKYAKLHAMIEDIAKKAKIPKPKIFIIPSETPNAFATGRNPKNAVVAATEGIIKSLSHDELKGVLAHEIGHVKNRDILVTTIAATLATIISYLAMMACFATIFGGGRNAEGKNIAELLMIGILTPIIAMVLRMAISRSREYLADRTGAMFLEDGKPLANALEKLELANKHAPLRFGNPTTSSLFIVNPFSATTMSSMFSTHPPMNERIKRLREMKF